MIPLYPSSFPLWWSLLHSAASVPISWHGSPLFFSLSSIAPGITDDALFSFHFLMPPSFDLDVLSCVFFPPTRHGSPVHSAVAIRPQLITAVFVPFSACLPRQRTRCLLSSFLHGVGMFARLTDLILVSGPA